MQNKSTVKHSIAEQPLSDLGSTDDRHKGLIIIVAVAIVFSILGMLLGSALNGAMVDWFTPVSTVHLTNVFADFNGDGIVDLMVKGDIILNIPLPPIPVP